MKNSTTNQITINFGKITIKNSEKHTIKNKANSNGEKTCHDVLFRV